MSNKLTKEQVKMLKYMMKGVSPDLSRMITMKSENDFIPISGGNLVPIEMYKNFINHFKDKNCYLWFLTYQKYFTNLWTIENATLQEKSAFKAHLICLFWFGCGAMVEVKGKLYSMGLTPIKSDLNGDIISGKVWKNNLSMTAFQPTNIKESIFPTDRIVYGKVGYNALPTIIFLATMIKNLDTMLVAFNTNIKFAAKKFKMKIKNNDSDIIRQELEVFRDVATGLIVEIMPANDADISNTIDEIKSSTDNTLIEQIKSYIGMIQTYNGIYSNTNFKKERNIGAEFKGDEIMTEIQLQEQKQELEKLVESMNEKFGKNFELVYAIQELIDLEQDDQDKFTNEGNTGQGENNE